MERKRYWWIKDKKITINSIIKPNLPKNLKEISDNIPHPEGIVVDDKNNIFVSSASTGNIFIIEKGKVRVHTNTKGRPLGIAYSKKLNELYVSDASIKSILSINIRTSYVEKISDTFDNNPLNGPSDLVLTDEGSIVFTDPIRNPFPNPCISPTYILDNDRKIKQLIPDLAFPSGIAYFDKKVFISETRANRLIALSININEEENNIEPELFRRFAEPGNPDGLTIDDDGDIYQTLPGIGAIAVINKQGEMVEIYHMDNWKPSNIHFNEGTFYVTDRLGSRIFQFSK